MSIGGWSTLTAGPGSAGGWGGGPATQSDEALFQSLSPVNGMVTGEQVKGVFQSSGLPSPRLAQIWTSVDTDKDGKITLPQFIMAMSMIRQAKQGPSLQASLPAAGFANFSSPMASPMADPLSQTWATPALLGQQSTPSQGGVAKAEGWALKTQDKRKYTMQFNLLDKNKTGKLSGAELSPIMNQLGLHTGTLSKIWELADLGKDGYLSCDEFIIAMSLIEGTRSGLALPRVLPQELYPGPTKFATVDRKATTQSNFANFPSTSSDALSKTWASPTHASLSQQNTPSKESWTLSTQEKRKYVMQFNALDKSATGKLSGAEVSPIMSQFGLHTGNISRIWELADLDKDGYLSCDEFVIAVSLAEGVKAGLPLPRVLPHELYPGPSKFATIDRKASSPRTDRPLEKRSSVIDPADWASRQSLTLDDPGLSFEDKRKENFEAGRLELERRRRALQEEQERIAAEKERKKREEEERRLQQEREAEAARQAELERQHQKALEIEKERERQMQKLALQREAEQRELERKRKEEWARKRQAELEGERTKERSSLHLLMDQHSKLEQELQMLDQRRIGAQASVERQRSMCVEISKVIRSLQLSRDIRLEELRKAQGELNTLQARVSTLHQQRGVLQAGLNQRSEGSGYQTTRQTLKDQFIGLAALMAGLRTNLSRNTEEINKLRTSFKDHQHTLEGLTSTQQSEDIKIRQLRIMVETRKREWSERQRREQAEREAKAAEEKRVREEQERIQREIEERAKKEERLAKIKQDQEMARKKAALESVMADLSAANTPPPARKPATKPEKKASPPMAKKPAPSQARPVPTKRNKKEEAAKDKEVMKKVAELQARKQQLQKQRSEQEKDTPTKKTSDTGPPAKPAPYAGHKLKNILKPQKAEKQPKEEQRLLDLMSTWDSSSGTLVGVRQFKQDTSQILQPSKPGEGVASEEETTPTTIDHVVVSSTEDGNVQVSALDSNQPVSDDMAVYAVPRSLTTRSVTSKATPTSDSNQTVTSVPSSDVGQTPTASDGASFATSTIPIRYRAIYNYETSDPSEVNLKEGDIVTIDPSIDPPKGWIMVEVANGEAGWAPESYLERLPEETRVESEFVQPEERVVSPPNQMATVMFSWTGSKDNHLSIVKGERIAILQQGEKWWSAEKDGKVGWFPRTFVKLEESKEETTTSEAAVTQQESISTAEAAPRPADHVTESTNQNAPRGQMYEAIYDYDSTTEGDLTFKAGDVIEITASEGEWWTGVLNGVQGNFPSNYVQPRYDVAPLQSSSAQGSPSHSTPSTHHTESQGTVEVLSKPAVAKVVVAFHAQKDGQLSLAPGDLIKVSKKAGNGWWEGELQARGRQRVRGWFPANRVELLGQRKSNISQTSITSIASRSKSPLLDVLEDSPSGGSSENLVLALYTYDATSADELSFHKGSVLTVLSKDGEWWQGELNGEKGLFPSNYVQPLMEQQAPSSEPTRWADSVSADVLAAVSDQERKRQEAIFELVTSERYYTDSLKLVKEVFFDPMREAEVLSDEELQKVVVNWDELIKCSSDLLKAFMVRLRTSGAVVKSIGDVLSNQIPELTPHVRWCSCQLTACTILQQKTTDPQFKEFEQRCMQDSRTGGLPLSSFLLKPMQRVTKYPLLIKRILDYTVEGELDFNDLQQALERAEKLCDQVNEAVRHKENTEQLEWLQTHIHFTLDENLIFNSATNFMGSRRLLHWGKLFKIRGAKDVIAFLFNDFLLMAKPKLFFPRAATPADLEPFGKNEFTMYRQPFLLEGVRAKKAPEDQYGPSVLLLTHSEDKDIPLRADSDHIRDQWLKIITRAGLEYITTKKKMDREKKELRMRTMKDSVGFLKVTVVEASDLLAKDPNGKSDPFCVLTLGGQQEQTTPTVHNNLNPKWNHLIEFYVHDINKEELEVTVFDKDLFSPNDFLGCAKVSLKDLFRDGDSPWTKRLLLEDVAKGEIELRIELVLKASDLLL